MPLTTFLFWNLNRQPLQHLVSALASDHDVDVLILAECQIGIADLLDSINAGRRMKYDTTFSPSPRLVMLTLFPDTSIEPILDQGGVSIRRIHPPLGVDIILVAVHLSSKLYQDSGDQALAATRLPKLIERTEEQAGHTRTVVVGDFNMNPFEAGLVGADTLHAVMDRAVAVKGFRIVGEERKYFFYNPMWSCFGDRSSGPSGSYFYRGSSQTTFFWNIFDQVLLRPELLPRFKTEDIEIVTRAGAVSLLDANGIPDKVRASDHLPILLRLRL
jgi:hypothetical protein